MSLTSKKQQQKPGEGVDIILSVPYYSQFLDLDNKMDMLTSCGMTCVKMLLDYYNIKSLSLNELVTKGKTEGGYGKSGWVHDYFVNLLISFNLESHREEKINTEEEIKEIKISLDKGNPIICSVAKRLFDKRMFHMILLIGYEASDNGEVLGFYYHNPESTSREAGRDCYVSIADFAEYWRHMAIFASPNLKINLTKPNK